MREARKDTGANAAPSRTALNADLRAASEKFGAAVRVTIRNVTTHLESDPLLRNRFEALAPLYGGKNEFLATILWAIVIEEQRSHKPKRNTAWDTLSKRLRRMRDSAKRIAAHISELDRGVYGSSLADFHGSLNQGSIARLRAKTNDALSAINGYRDELRVFLSSGRRRRKKRSRRATLADLLKPLGGACGPKLPEKRFRDLSRILGAVCRMRHTTLPLGFSAAALKKSYQRYAS